MPHLPDENGVMSPGSEREFVGCTAGTVSYLPRARVAAESWREHHPGSPFYVLVVDDDDRPDDDEPFQIVRPHELHSRPRSSPSNRASTTPTSSRALSDRR